MLLRSLRWPAHSVKLKSANLKMPLTAGALSNPDEFVDFEALKLLLRVACRSLLKCNEFYGSRQCPSSWGVCKPPNCWGTVETFTK